MKESKSVGEQPEPVSKSSTIKGVPKVVDQKPIAPNHARIVLKIVKIRPEVQAAGTGPCSQAPCKAEAQVVQVLGYGSSFLQTLGEGEIIQVNFPMSMQATEEWAGVQVGQKIVADMRGSLVEGGPLVIHTYRLHP